LEGNAGFSHDKLLKLCPSGGDLLAEKEQKLKNVSSGKHSMHKTLKG